MDNHIANQFGPKGAVLAELGIIDARSVRALRSVLAAQAGGQTPAASDLSALAGLESEAAALRARLAE